MTEKKIITFEDIVESAKKVGLSLKEEREIEAQLHEAEDKVAMLARHLEAVKHKLKGASCKWAEVCSTVEPKDLDNFIHILTETVKAERETHI
jgi:hypothetical protein